MPKAEKKLPDYSDFDFRFVLRTGGDGVRKGDRTRAAIGHACCSLLEQMPLPELTVAKICQSVGIAHGTFYIHYSDRHALVTDLLSRFVRYIQDVMRNASRTTSGNPVRAATAVYYKLFEQNRGLMKCMVNNLDEFPEAQEAFQELNKEWAGIVVAATQRKMVSSGRTNTISSDELYRRAYALGGMVDQYLSTLLLAQEPKLVAVSQDPDTVIDTLTFIWNRTLEL